MATARENTMRPLLAVSTAIDQINEKIGLPSASHRESRQSYAATGDCAVPPRSVNP
jgi:hypothetical protein